MATTICCYDGKEVTVLTCAEAAEELRAVLEGTFPGVNFTITAHEKDEYMEPGIYVTWIRGALSQKDPREENNCEAVVSSLANYRVGRHWDGGYNRYDYAVYPGAREEYGPGDYHTYESVFGKAASFHD